MADEALKIGGDTRSIFKDKVMELLPEGGNLEPRRTDKDFFTSVITQDMFEYLEYSRFALTDITGLNPNVFYELGIRHRARPAGTVIFRQLAAKIPFDDFDTNAVGTLNLLEATRLHRPGAVFVHMSTNKVYGDAPNELPLVEQDKRWDYASPNDFDGITEHMRIDQSKHSLFGASKVAADVMVQEYGRYFGMKTCCLRGGCLTGPNHSGVELHGFLSYLVKCNLEGKKYSIFGYKGKQVRDNIHSLDVARFIHAFIENPRSGEVYNLGGGRGNSCSIYEAFDMIEAISGRKMLYEYVDKNREGDHICYISNLKKMTTQYPGWGITKTLKHIFEEIHQSWLKRAAAVNVPI